MSLPDLEPGVLTAVQILLIVVFALVATVGLRRGAGLAVRRVLDREADEGTASDLAAIEIEKRARTIEALAVRTGSLLILIVTVLTILQTLGINIGPAIAGFGIAGLAIGLGTQTLVRDWVAGILIVVENQFSRGDVVQIAGVTGTVEHVSLRRTVIRSDDGTVHSVPNGEIRVASNQTKFWSGIALEIELIGADRGATAREAIDRIGREMKSDPEWGPLILNPPHVDRISQITERGVKLLVLGSARTKTQWKIASELRRRVLESLGPEGIVF